MRTVKNTVTAIMLTAPAASLAQHASDNAVLSAEDAFGMTLGLEGVGLYGAGGIRGFNPQAAGNVRIDGLYFDQQGGLTNRVIEGSTIRIGISEIGYPFPAPTGIVDYSLRHAGDGTPGASIVASAGPFEARGFSVDGNVPVLGSELQLPIGASLAVSSNTPLGTVRGYTSDNRSFGATPQWTPSDSLTVRAMFDWQQSTHARTLPGVFPGGDFLPPLVDNYIGQNWAEGRSSSMNYGALLNARLNPNWSLSAGIFRSQYDSPVSFSDLYVDTQTNGAADHIVVGYPDQNSASTSGEARLTGRFPVGSWRHNFIFEIRGRDTLARYGGSDVVDVGQTFIGEALQVAEPDFSYSGRTHDLTQLWSAGIAYRAQWQAHGDFSIGIQRESYSKSVDSPGISVAHLSARPLRGYTTAAFTVTKTLTTYSGYTQGLEDSGTAPGVAVNRGAVLPAARTWQADTGIRYLLTPKLKVIAGVFQIQKPYFNLDTGNVDRQLGLQRARGFEMSLSGEVISQLNVTAGVLAGKVSIIGNNLRADGVGPVAFGQPRTTYLVDADYRFARLPAVSADVTWFRFGAAPGSVDNGLYDIAQTLIALGGRYRFTLMGHPATLRVTVQNAADERFWNMALSPGFYQFQGPSLQGYVTADI